MDINIPSQIKRQTAAEWAADTTVYSNMLLVTSDVFYDSTTFPQFKIANGTDAWSVLDYAPFDEVFFRLNNIESDIGTLFGQVSQEITDRQSADSALQTDIDNHEADNNNPHNVTLDQARSGDNFFTGTVDMNNNALTNLPAPMSSGDAANKAYVDGLVDNTLKAAEAFSPVGSYPTTYGGGPIQKGDTFRLGAGTMGGVTVEGEELLIALVDNPGQTDANYQILESNRNQATESVKGIAKIATQAEAEDENTTQNETILTPQKGWFMLWRFLGLDLSWVGKHTFQQAPVLETAGATKYLKTNGSMEVVGVSGIPAADISGTKTSSFISDFASAVSALGYLLASTASSTYQTVITAASWGSFINGLTSKSTPVDADYVGLMDSAASNVSKKLSWANIKATLKTYFDTLYEPVITKLSAFNKNFGTSAGTVTEGNDYRLNLLHVVDAGSLSVSSPADSATVYVGISTPLVPVGTAANRQFKLPTGVLRMVNMYVDPTGTLGTNENVTVNLRNITDSTSSTIGTITYDAKGNSTFVTGLSITTSSAKLYAIEYVYPAFSTNPTNVYTVNQLFIYAS